MQNFHKKLTLLLALTLLASCNVRPTTFEETLSEDQQKKYGLDGRSKLSDDGLDGAFAGDKDKAGRDNTTLLNGGNLQINRYLWTASLDVISFMPLAQVDAVGGVILTEWHALPEKLDERYKTSIIITGTTLRADALNVTLFKQQQIGDGWQSVEVSQDTQQQVKDAILTRAREIRFFSLGQQG